MGKAANVPRHDGIAPHILFEERTAMKRLTTAFSLILIVALTVLSGMVHGHLSGRWGDPPEVKEAARKLKELPREFGPWRMHSEEEMTDHVRGMLECDGYLFRTYVHQETGESVRVAFLLGPSGPISVHTPEICYSSRDYDVRDEKAPMTVEDGEGAAGEFWVLTFQSRDVNADLLRVCYAWSAGRDWSIPKEPRFTFAASPHLYKIQMASVLPPGADLETEDTCRKFLHDFMPVARQYMMEPVDE